MPSNITKANNLIDKILSTLDPAKDARLYEQLMLAHIYLDMAEAKETKNS